MERLYGFEIQIYHIKLSLTVINFILAKHILIKAFHNQRTKSTKFIFKARLKSLPTTTPAKLR